MNFKLKMSTGGNGFYNNMLIGTLPSDLLPYEQKYPVLLIDNTGSAICFLEVDGNSGKMYIRQLDTSGGSVFILYGEVTFFSGTINSAPSPTPGG